MENTNSMSVTRALAELKLLDSRIRSAVANRFVISYKQSAKTVDTVNTPNEFADKAKSSYQKVNDLIDRRKKIKSAIVGSNASTCVTISGKTMTVAEAIERKDSIQYEQLLVNELVTQYNSAMVNARKQNELVQVKLDELLLTSFGKEGKTKASEDEIAMISKPYLAQNEYVVLDAINLKTEIDKLKEDIETFLTEVDFVLSTSNALTNIEI